MDGLQWKIPSVDDEWGYPYDETETSIYPVKTCKIWYVGFCDTILAAINSNKPNETIYPNILDIGIMGISKQNEAWNEFDQFDDHHHLRPLTIGIRVKMCLFRFAIGECIIWGFDRAYMFCCGLQQIREREGHKIFFCFLQGQKFTRRFFSQNDMWTLVAQARGSTNDGFKSTQVMRTSHRWGWIKMPDTMNFGGRIVMKWGATRLNHHPWTS